MIKGKIRIHTLATLTLQSILIVCVSEEVAGHQSSDSIDLSHVEPVVVHLAVNVDYLTRLKTQLGLEYIKTLVVVGNIELLRIDLV